MGTWWICTEEVVHPTRSNSIVVIPPTSFLRITRGCTNIPIVVWRSTLDKPEVMNLSNSFPRWVRMKRLITHRKHGRDSLFDDAFLVSSMSIFVSSLLHSSRSKSSQYWLELREFRRRTIHDSITRFFFSLCRLACIQWIINFHQLR